MNFNERIEDKLLEFFDHEAGEQKSIQGELYQKYHECHNGSEYSGEWEDYKYEANRNGYSVEYLVDLVQKYLDDNPDVFLGYKDSESDKIEFMSDLLKCTSADDVNELIGRFELQNEVEETLDFSKCSTTQKQLNTMEGLDEDLNWLIGWLTDHALPEWNDKYIDKLRNSLELLRPEVPIGVVSYESEKEWYRQNNKEANTDARPFFEAQDFIRKSIFSWIYQNPDLIGLNGNDLGKSVKETFTGESTLKDDLIECLRQWENENNLNFLAYRSNRHVLPEKKNFAFSDTKDLTNLTELDLSKYKLTELPKEIFYLTNLTKLDLSQNKLTEIPKEIGNLTKLTSLNLMKNKLTKIPKEIGNLTNLKTLNLYSNKLTEIPSEISNLTNLKTLNLYSNKLTEIPSEIGNLINLTKLIIGPNKIRID